MYIYIYMDKFVQEHKSQKIYFHFKHQNTSD